MTYTPWLPHEDNRLTNLRRRSLGWLDISNQIAGRTPSACESRWRYLQRPEHRLFRPEPPAALAIPDGDERHVAACIAEGGFPYADVIDGEAVWVWPYPRPARAA